MIAALSDSMLMDRVSALEAENERLREALRNIGGKEVWDDSGGAQGDRLRAVADKLSAQPAEEE